MHKLVNVAQMHVNEPSHLFFKGLTQLYLHVITTAEGPDAERMYNMHNYGAGKAHEERMRAVKAPKRSDLNGRISRFMGTGKMAAVSGYIDELNNYDGRGPCCRCPRHLRGGGFYLYSLALRCSSLITLVANETPFPR